MFNFWGKKKKPLLSQILPDKLELPTPEIEEVEVEEPQPVQEEQVDLSYISVSLDRNGSIYFNVGCIPGREADFASIFVGLNKGIFAPQIFESICHLPQSQLVKIEKQISKQYAKIDAKENEPLVSPLIALQVMGSNNDRPQ